ncbi:hypothetical protein ACFYQA_35605 [Streptomyces sp. NPDC005774]|uniref:hypothetical protein n=1 Tax=Streptomyces sp. NPDC005774 TaxID=3364728 RepID=UPI0036B1BC75
MFRTPPADRAAAFRKLDADGNGTLSVDELLGALRQYYVGPETDAAGNWLYGPVV